MPTNSKALAELGPECLFLAWAPRSLGAPRSQVLANELGIEEQHFIYLTTRRGLLFAPWKYAYQAVRTLLLLFRKRPRIVLVQSPPSLAVLFVYLYCALTNSRYLVEAHSAAFQYAYWTRPRWLYRFLARKAITTIVTNKEFQQLVHRSGGSAFIVRDIATTFPKAKSYPLHGSFNVVVVSTFSSDEPLREVLEAAADLEEVQFYITGKKAYASRELLASAPGNVHFTDFLPDASYYALLSSSQAVMCLSTRDHTMQYGACEALWLGKPIITSDWPLLRAYFDKGTVHVPNTSAGIRQGVREMKEHYHQYDAGIKELQIAQRQEWHEKAQALARMVQQVTQPKLKTNKS